MNDYYTTADLKERGWTDSIIKQHLGKPDGARTNPQGWFRARIELFAVHRVHELESGKVKADLEKISDTRDLARRAYGGREKLFTRHWIIH
jgi:hypothetical protein